MLCDVWIASCSSAGVKGWLYFSGFLDLKLSFCYSALLLKVRKCGLKLLREEFAENVTASVSAMSFLVVEVFGSSCLFCFFFCCFFCCFFFFRYFPHHPPDNVCSGRGTKLVDMVLPTFLLGFRYDFSCFCSEKFKSV